MSANSINRRRIMTTDLLPITASHMPKAWREAIARAREAGGPETVVQLIAVAAKRGKIDENGWHPEVVNEACLLIRDLPRSKTRASRLRGLLKRTARAATATEARKELEDVRGKVLALSGPIGWQIVARILNDCPAYLRQFGSKWNYSARSHVTKFLDTFPELERRDMDGIKCWIRKRSAPPRKHRHSHKLSSNTAAA